MRSLLHRIELEIVNIELNFKGIRPTFAALVKKTYNGEYVQQVDYFAELKERTDLTFELLLSAAMLA